MTHESDRDGALSPTKRALAKIRDLKRQLADVQQGHGGDIAIVSMACRFPRRSRSPELFWEALVNGTDEVGEVPSDRWDLDAYYDENPDAAGKMYARQRRLSRSARSDGPRVLRDLAPRSHLDRPTTTTSFGGELGGARASRLAV